MKQLGPQIVPSHQRRRDHADVNYTFHIALLALFTAGCAFMVWRQFRRTEAARREAERGTAELEELAEEVLERMPVDTPKH